MLRRRPDAAGGVIVAEMASAAAQAAIIAGIDAVSFTAREQQGRRGAAE
jgi:hypothetical protein